MGKNNVKFLKYMVKVILYKMEIVFFVLFWDDVYLYDLFKVV